MRSLGSISRRVSSGQSCPHKTVVLTLLGVSAVLFVSCSQPSKSYGSILFARGEALLHAHGQSHVRTRVGDLFQHNGDGVCYVSSRKREMLEQNSAKQFYAAIPEIIRRTQGFSDEEHWFVVFVAGSRVTEVLRTNGWHSRVAVTITLPDGKVADDDGCFSAMDTAEIDETTLDGSKGIAVRLSMAANAKN